LPTGTISGNTEVCEGPTSSIITFKGFGGTAPYNFTYKIGNGVAQTVRSDASGVATVGQSNGIVGTYLYTLLSVSDATTTACENAQTGIVTIKVNPNTTLNLTSAPATAAQTVCLNCAVNNITYQAENANSVTVSGLPAGLTSTSVNGKLTITGTATALGTFTYTVTAAGICTTEVLTGTITVTESPAITLVKTGIISSDKNTIKYTFKIINTGNVTLKNLTLTDVKIPSLNISSTITLLPGASTETTATYTITQAEKDAGKVSNSATATGVSPGARTVTDKSGTDQNSDAPTVITVPQSPALAFTKVATGTVPATLGGIITYELKVTNTGTVTLYNLVVTDPNAVISGGSPIASLAPNASVIVTATHKITQADLDAGKVINQATVKGTDPNNGNITKPSDDPATPASEDPTVTPLNQSGAIALVKTGATNNNGTAIIFSFNITNTGNVTLKNISLSDPMLGGAITLSNTTLLPGQTISVNKTYILTLQDKNAGKVTNTATVKGITPTNTTVTDISGTELLNDTPTIIEIDIQPRISLVKTGVLSSDFATITYTFQITNIGNVTITNLNLMDTKFTSSIPLSKTTLDPGQSLTTTAVYTVTDAEKRDGKVLNTATVTATSPSGSPVKDISGTESNNDDPTVHIIDDSPQALNDNGETKINQPVTINLAVNDLPSFNGIDKGSIIITRYPTNGQVQVNSDGTIIYTPNRGYSGPDDFRYTINDLKGKVSNVALVNITVTPIDLFIPNTFTPNGDGKNDTFKIIGRESFDNINLLIFNRWGNEVYRNTNYLDEWDGSGLSEGTYYYVIVLKKGANEVSKKGWILLKR
ncbi:gliding motility-associated C-terminal domain-containing protein, partial [Pedobacter sp. MC2016-15]|uniref:DUF7507 domain-containing protein n=1 Tax=Pedobacter sp. MC2016-15 TaxID=2994473 RepID=UPI0022474538